MKHTILLICNDVIGPAMTGFGIRYTELAHYLALDHTVTLAGEQIDPIFHGDGYTTCHVSQALARLSDYDVVIAPNLVDYQKQLSSLAIIKVADLYAPLLSEGFEYAASIGSNAQFTLAKNAVEINLCLADLVICSNERQIDLYTATELVSGGLSPRDYASNGYKHNEHYIVVPPGYAKVSRGKLANPYGKDDFVALWGGGIWNWLDPKTVIEAMAQIKDDDIKLYFLASGSPNKAIPAMRAGTEAVELARSLGLINKTVFFLDGWRDRASIAPFFAHAKVGISAHPASIETRYATRTRYFDYMNYGLPMVLSSGDILSDEFSGSYAITVTPGDAMAMAAAITKLKNDTKRYDTMTELIERDREQFSSEYFVGNLSARLGELEASPSVSGGGWLVRRLFWRKVLIAMIGIAKRVQLKI